MSENYEVNESASLLDLLGLGESAPIDQGELQAQVIRIQSSAGGVVDVPVVEDHAVDGIPGYTLREVLELASVTVSPNTQYWMGETQIQLDTVIAPGATITAIGLMKGGQ